jgi:hypothetical protein
MLGIYNNTSSFPVSKEIINQPAMKTLCITLMLCLSLGAFSQKWDKSVNANYNWTFISQSIEGDFNLRKNHNTLSFGMQVYVATYPDFDEGSYKNAAYADTWYNHIGLNFSYQYNIFKDQRTVNPFLFYQTMVSHLCFHKVGGDLNIGDDWRSYGVTDPYWIMENVIGAGFVFQLYENLNVFQSAGYGYSFFFGDDTYTMSAENEWTYTLKIGLLYHL